MIDLDLVSLAIIPTVISAGADLVGGAVDTFTSRKNFKEKNRIEMERYEDMKRYNSPAAQAARMRSAGLAPQAAVQQIAGTSAATPPPEYTADQSGRVLGQSISGAGRSAADTLLQEQKNDIDSRRQQSDAALNGATQKLQETLTGFQQVMTDLKSIEKAIQSENLDFLVSNRQLRNDEYLYKVDQLRSDSRRAWQLYLQSRFDTTTRPAFNEANLESIRTANRIAAVQANLRERYGETISGLEILELQEKLEALRLGNTGLDLQNQRLSFDNSHMAGRWYMETRRFGLEYTSDLYGIAKTKLESAYINDQRRYMRDVQGPYMRSLSDFYTAQRRKTYFDMGTALFDRAYRVFDDTRNYKLRKENSGGKGLDLSLGEGVSFLKNYETLSKYAPLLFNAP